jgi:hypothetical protein
MPRVYVSTVIAAPVAEVWRVIRDFNALPDWTPFVRDSRIEGGIRGDQVGCIRNFTLRDGGVIRERLLALSDYEMSCSYAILESPMAVSDYIATLGLTPITETSQTFAFWQADFDCSPDREAALAAQIGQGVFQTGLSALKQRFR